jgi:phenylalanyl-tRNA synthetase beta chain
VQVPLRLDRVKTLAGIDIPAGEQRSILRALGFASAEAGSEIVVEPPSWRPDISGEADIVEEVVRVYGLDKVAHASLPRLEAVTGRRVTPAQRRRFLAARTLASRGMNEAVTWSFVPKALAELFGGGARALELANPISTELSDMRPSLLPNLIAATGRNMARGIADLSLCEVGQVYAGDRPEDERIHVSGIRSGANGPRHWSGERRPVDVFDAKADALAVLAAAGAPVDKLQTIAEGPAWYHPGRVGTLSLGPKNRLAVFGEIHPRVLAAMDVAGPLVAFEVDLDAIPLPKAARTARPALDASPLQPVTRDYGGRERGPDPAGGAWRRQDLDRKGVGVRCVCRGNDRRGQQVRGDRGDAAAAREDADGRGHRPRLERGRGGRLEGDRSTPQGMRIGGIPAPAPFIALPESPSIKLSRRSRSPIRE